MSVLVVVSHPDDEILGAGGTLWRFAQAGREVNSCILCGEVDVRRYRPSLDELQEDLVAAHEEIGIRPIAVGDFPNIRLNTVPHVELVRFIEQAIETTAPSLVITHHPSDLNNDHLHTSRACQAAARLFQRRPDVAPLRELWFMEVLSSTEWAFRGPTRGFEPDTFVEIGRAGLDKKISALSHYRGVMRDFPHPRSPEALEAQAVLRAVQAGQSFTEAFQTAFRRLAENDTAPG